jgi:hypothetical protein
MLRYYRSFGEDGYDPSIDAAATSADRTVLGVCPVIPTVKSYHPLGTYLIGGIYEYGSEHFSPEIRIDNLSSTWFI